MRRFKYTGTPAVFCTKQDFTNRETERPQPLLWGMSGASPKRKRSLDRFKCAAPTGGLILLKSL